MDDWIAAFCIVGFLGLLSYGISKGTHDEQIMVDKCTEQGGYPTHVQKQGVVCLKDNTQISLTK
jgi:hypothetical protein